MIESVQEIQFQGKDFILTSPNGSDSPIATIKEFQNGDCSFAHFYRGSGKIMRFHEQIGTIDDIEFGEFIDIEVDILEVITGLFGRTWSL